MGDSWDYLVFHLYHQYSNICGECIMWEILWGMCIREMAAGSHSVLAVHRRLRCLHLLKNRKSSNKKSHLQVAFLLLVAEWEGFEPSRPCDPNDLANRPLQPLEYHSIYGGEGGIRTHGALRHHWFSRPAP